MDGSLYFRQEPQRYESPSRHAWRTGGNTHQSAGQMAARTTANPLIANTSTDLQELEHQIKRHPRLKPHLETVCTYLVIDMSLLEPISWLRQEGLWSQEMATMYTDAPEPPQSQQVKALAATHISLYNSPPTDLFNLVCKYRYESHGRATGIVQRLKAFRDDAPAVRQSRPDVGKTAPDGKAYACPSKRCTRKFRKGKHASNHVQENHPEYLQLYPDYKPADNLVDDDGMGSGPTSPESSRDQVRRRNGRHSEHPQRHAPVPEMLQNNTDQFEFPISDHCDYFPVPSPRSFGLSSLDDTEETRSSSPAPRTPRSPQLTYRQALTPLTQRPGSSAHSLHHKRARDSLSSTESAMTDPSHAFAIARPQRRQSKRLSVHNPVPQNWTSL